MKSVLVSSLIATAFAGCIIEKGVDYEGHDLTDGVRATATAEECCDTCSEATSQGCRVWTWAPPSTCFLKASDNGRRRAGDPEVPPEVESYVSGFAEAAGGSCKDDWDCSLAGECKDGVCSCDAWATGTDCSRLNLQPVDKAALGYMDPQHSSWGGNAVKDSKGTWHLYMAEIACNSEDSGTRCGLGNWENHSQVAHAVSANPEGPYVRQELTFPQERHNPTLQVSPVDKGWHIFSINQFDGPIVVSSSYDEGKTWSDAAKGVQVSGFQNPGPLLLEDGSMTMVYRDVSALPEPSCSTESIGIQYCPNHTSACSGGRNPIFNHTAEDPSVFRDHRGNWHMLMNALPYKCQPKLNQGGHAWSRDGVTWSEPRVGAYDTTVQFTDGTNMTCVRRERPQMVLDDAGFPLVFFSATTGCPLIEGTPYKGASDCFTMAQLMARPSEILI